MLVLGWLNVTPIAIDAPQIQAPLVAVGIDDSGQMQPPDDPDTAGWMMIGKHHLILDGHVDWNYRLRPFSNLRYLNEGDEIDVTGDDGNSYAYTVVWSHVFDLDSIPEEVFQPTAIETLTAITCAGQFIDGEYQSRRVVWAELNAD
ncbi:MAG TPA: class F sortase [Ktedonobacteraceae bacterium]|nr:class F sortase [Ktedonobacteraceae bacterium]